MQSTQGSFLFTFFCFAMYKMVDSGCSIDIYKSEKISIRTDHPDHLNTTKICKRAVKKVPYLLRYISDQYKTQKMCDKTILENGGIWKCFPDCYKN